MSAVSQCTGPLSMRCLFSSHTKMLFYFHQDINVTNTNKSALWAGMSASVIGGAKACHHTGTSVCSDEGYHVGLPGGWRGKVSDLHTQCCKFTP